MFRYWRISVILLMLAAILAGCTGGELSPQSQWTLDDLYMSSIGTMIHMQIGQKIADDAGERGGAVNAGVNLRIPFTRLTSDVWAVYNRPGGQEWTLWEIKPDHYFFMENRLADAIQQLDGYVDGMSKAEYTVRQANSGVYYPAPGEPVPDRYTPEAASRCVQVVVVSRPELASGRNIVGYTFRWHPDKVMSGKKCRNQDAEVKNQLLAGLASDAAEYVKQSLGHVNPAQFQLAITAKKTDLGTIRQQLVDIYTENDLGEWEIDQATTKSDVHRGLMKEYIPVLFKTAPQSSIPSFPEPGSSSDGSWYCDQKAC